MIAKSWSHCLVRSIFMVRLLNWLVKIELSGLMTSAWFYKSLIFFLLGIIKLGIPVWLWFIEKKCFFPFYWNKAFWICVSFLVSSHVEILDSLIVFIYLPSRATQRSGPWYFLLVWFLFFRNTLSYILLTFALQNKQTLVF